MENYFHKFHVVNLFKGDNKTNHYFFFENELLLTKMQHKLKMHIFVLV
jgi:hypothetical protein